MPNPRDDLHDFVLEVFRAQEHLLQARQTGEVLRDSSFLHWARKNRLAAEEQKLK